MVFLKHAAAGMAALTSFAAASGIDVDNGFQIGNPDSKLQGSSPRAQALAQPAAASSSTPSFFPSGATFSGNGFNTIFRPNSLGSGGTHFANVNSTDILELNLMNENLTFSNPIGNIPNRGLDPQPDIFLTGVPYLQQINDVTNPQTGHNDGAPVGIHFEPGMFVFLPATTNNPSGLPATINRIGSIPHGTTINAQALAPSQIFNGGPLFQPVDITPFVIGGGKKIRFPSQTANDSTTARLPQDLTKFIQQGTITQPILDNPNLVLANSIANQVIDKTAVFQLSTVPVAPITGGGTANDAFLTGGAGQGPNAFALQLNATFWFETVNWTVSVPPSKAGQTQLLKPFAPNPNVLLPTFSVTPAKDVTKATNITAQSLQIQYSQLVILNFNGLSWPHASVNTLTQQGNLPVPASAIH